MSSSKKLDQGTDAQGKKNSQPPTYRSHEFPHYHYEFVKVRCPLTINNIANYYEDVETHLNEEIIPILPNNPDTCIRCVPQSIFPGRAEAPRPRFDVPWRTGSAFPATVTASNEQPPPAMPEPLATTAGKH